MILKFWPHWPENDLPVNLNSLKICPVDFILNYIFYFINTPWIFNRGLSNPQWTRNCQIASLCSGTHWFQKCDHWKYFPSSSSILISMPFEILSKTKKNMFLKFWPQNQPSQFFLNYIFDISGFQWSKWVIDCLIWKTFIFQIQRLDFGYLYHN